MNCPNCNYLLTDESKPCPKCRQLAARYGEPPPPHVGAPSYAGANQPSPEWQQPNSAPGQPPTAPRYVGQPSPGYDPMYPQGQIPQGQVPQGYAPQGYAPQGQAPQGYAPQGYAPQGYGPQSYGSHPQQGYHPNAYGMQSQSVVPMTVEQSRKRNWIIGGCVTAFIGFIVIVSNMGGDKNAPTSAAGQTNAPAAPAVVALRVGPSFNEVDSKMDGRLSKWTDAQIESYWQSVAGTQVTWSGEVVEVSMKHGGKITLKCNPETMSSDTNVDLDGSQLEQLPNISKGRRVTVRAILGSHDTFGYDLTDGKIVG